MTERKPQMRFKVLAYIRTYTTANACAPTHDEIAHHFRCSRGRVATLIAELRWFGLLEPPTRKWRALKLTKYAEEKS